MKEKKKVYIVNYMPYMDDALVDIKMKHETINITEGNLNIFATDRLATQIKNTLKETKANSQDFLLLGGNTVINSIASIIMYNLTGRINYIIYDAKAKKYIIRENVKV